MLSKLQMTPEWIGLASLLTLLLQNTGYVLILKVSQTPPHDGYLTSTVVFMGEFMKLVICFLVLNYQGRRPWNVIEELRAIPMAQHMQLAVPTVLYAAQNNLIFMSISNLSAESHQVLAQLKILMTAVFSVVLLKKRLHRLHYIALILLFAGVTQAQLPGSMVVRDSAQESLQYSRQLKGIFAAIMIACLSGFANVYTEKVMKQDKNRSVFVINIQLAAFSLLANGLGVLMQDAQALSTGGFFQGYDMVTWLVILTNAGGGVLVGVVVRYTSSLAKTYVVSLAIFLTAAISYFWFGTELTLSFLLSTVVVICSVGLYNDPVIKEAMDREAAAIPLPSTTKEASR